MSWGSTCLYLLLGFAHAAHDSLRTQQQPAAAVTANATTRSVPTAPVALPATIPPQAFSAPRALYATGAFRVGSSLARAGARCGGFGPREVELRIRGRSRKLLMYLPQSARVPLWLLFHGSTETAEYFVRYTGLRLFAKAKKVGFLAFQGLLNPKNEATMFNVGRHAGPLLDFEVHDLEFVKTALREVLRLPCVDKRRIHCAGFSNGARFCMRLASEFSQVLASVVSVSGLRYPLFNNATRPVPILAFHGENDSVNPWHGHGFFYWQSSVVEAMQRWAAFNGCQGAHGPPSFLERGGLHQVLQYKHCKQGATVEVVKLYHHGHQWPGANWEIKGLGERSPFKANKLIYNFFYYHRLPKQYLSLLGTVEGRSFNLRDEAAQTRNLALALPGAACLCGVIVCLVALKAQTYRSYSPHLSGSLERVGRPGERASPFFQ